MSGTQMSLFEIEDLTRATGLDARLWHGSFNARESSLHQLSPYVGKMKSGMAKALISLFSNQGEVVLDPFSGSGVVPLEAALMSRTAWANDLSPYAYVLTQGKLNAPSTVDIALKQAEALVELVEELALLEDTTSVPDWIHAFFHPDTLREISVAFRLLLEREDYFLLSCLLGILHHVRPGFLSYPASHLVPYLRESKYPRDQFPEMYEYRDLRTRLLAKVKRAYRRPYLPQNWAERDVHTWNENSMELSIGDNSVHAIVSSPPYFGALDYARDNRLRLWFLGCKDWKSLDQELTANAKVYESQMAVCLAEMHRVLRPGRNCVLVLGDVERNGNIKRTAEVLADLAVETTSGGFKTEMIYDDRIPDERRSRRQTKTTKFERILVMSKQS